MFWYPTFSYFLAKKFLLFPTFWWKFLLFPTFLTCPTTWRPVQGLFIFLSRRFFSHVKLISSNESISGTIVGSYQLNLHSTRARFQLLILYHGQSFLQVETVSLLSHFRILWRREPRTHWEESRMLLSWVKRRNREEEQEATSLQASCPSTTLRGSRGSKWQFHWKRAQLLSRRSAREMCRWVSRLFIPGSGNLDVRDAHLMSRMLSALRPDWPLKRSVSFI